MIIATYLILVITHRAIKVTLEQALSWDIIITSTHICTLTSQHALRGNRKSIYYSSHPPPSSSSPDVQHYLNKSLTRTRHAQFQAGSGSKTSIIAGIVLAGLVAFIAVSWQIWCLSRGKRSVFTCCMKPRRVKWRKRGGAAKDVDHELGLVREGVV